MNVKWQSFLDRIHFASEKTTKQKTLTLIGVFIWTSVAIVLPYLLNQTYQYGWLSSIISLVMLLILVLYVKKQWTYNTHKWSYNYPTILSNIGIIILTLNILYLLFPIVRLTTSPTGGIQNDTVYVAYSPKCKYCVAANSNLTKAVSIYNATHTRNVRVVNMEKKSQTVTDILEYVDRVGTLIYIDNTGKAHTDFYTLGKGDTPIEPPVDYIYQKFRQYIK